VYTSDGNYSSVEGEKKLWIIMHTKELSSLCLSVDFSPQAADYFPNKYLYT
jgi:hypothetical protein